MALFVTLGFRILYSGIAAWFVPSLELDPALIRSNHLTEHLMQRSAGLPYYLCGVWERFDTLWYIEIAQHGYQRPESVVFYPLYPALIRLLSSVTHQPLIAAVLISTVASFFLFLGLQKLLAPDLPPETVQRALILCGVWPASFIFFAAYAESLVLALIVWSIYFARTDRWWLAGLVGLFAGLAKAVGILAAVPLAILAWRDRSSRAFPAVLCLLGPVLFTLYLRLTGHMLPGEVYPQFWKTEVAVPWDTLFGALRTAIGARNPVLGFQLTLFLLAAALALSKTIRLEYTLYAAAVLCFILLKKGTPEHYPLDRYVLVVFPAYANLGYYLGRRLTLPVMMLLLVVNVVILRIYLDWSMIV